MGSKSMIRLHDGTPITADYFTIRDELRRITHNERRGIALAWHVCAGTPRYSIVLTKSEGIVAWAIAAESAKLACEWVELGLSEGYQRDKRFARNMLAVLNFIPTSGEALFIAATGVDVLFIPEPLAAGIDGADEALLDFWLGRPREQFRAGDPNGLQKRALMYPEKSLTK